MISKKGGWDFLYGTFSIIIGLVLIIVFLSVTGVLDSIGGTSATEGLSKAVTIIQDVTKSLASAIFKIVAPSGVDENTQYVALGLFLLVWVVGSYSLANVGFFGPLSAFFISFIVGMVGSRLLTKEIIERSNLAAGPLTAMLLIFAVFPIMLTKGILDKVYRKKERDLLFLSKNEAKRKLTVWRISIARTVFWALLAFLYWFVVATVLEQGNTNPLAWAYGLAALLFGIFDSYKYMKVHMLTEEEAREAGRGIAMAKRTVEEAKALLRGEEFGAEEAVGSTPRRT